MDDTARPARTLRLQLQVYLWESWSCMRWQFGAVLSRIFAIDEEFRTEPRPNNTTSRPSLIDMERVITTIPWWSLERLLPSTTLPDRPVKFCNSGRAGDAKILLKLQKKKNKKIDSEILAGIRWQNLMFTTWFKNKLPGFMSFLASYPLTEKSITFESMASKTHYWNVD